MSKKVRILEELKGIGDDIENHIKKGAVKKGWIRKLCEKGIHLLSDLSTLIEEDRFKFGEKDKNISEERGAINKITKAFESIETYIRIKKFDEMNNELGIAQSQISWLSKIID